VPHARNMVDYWRYCQDLVRQRREREGDDLPSDLLREQKNGADISDDEIAGVLYSVLFAGHETTTTLMGNGLRELLKHRDGWEALVADPSLIPAAVDEVLRFAPSIVAWRRKALNDTSINGVPVPKGSNILLLIGSANRDDTVFSDPQHFDIHRKDARKHLAFGYGIHTCVGQQLAKIEFIIALEELTRRMPGLRLKPDQTFEFARNSSFRVPTALHVQWKVA
jgi:cytochrome P450